jgi:hypothetical protein
MLLFFKLFLPEFEVNLLQIKAYIFLSFCRTHLALKSCDGNERQNFIIQSIYDFRQTQHRRHEYEGYGRRPLEKPRRRWEDNIKMYFTVVGWSCMDWINLTQDRDR